jgi:hypothetical protein
MTYEGTMMGSGIYSEEVTLGVECHNEECGHYWDADVATDDWGNIDYAVTCPECLHEFRFVKEAEEIETDNEPDRMWDDEV